MFGYHDYRCRNEVISRVCTILTHTAAYIHLLSALHASSAKLCIPAGTQELVRKSTLETQTSKLARPEETGTECRVPSSRREYIRPPAEGPVRKLGDRCGERLGRGALCWNHSKTGGRRMSSVAELRVEVGIESYPEGAGEGR